MHVHTVDCDNLAGKLGKHRPRRMRHRCIDNGNMDGGSGYTIKQETNKTSMMDMLKEDSKMSSGGLVWSAAAFAKPGLKPVKYFWDRSGHEEPGHL